MAYALLFQQLVFQVSRFFHVHRFMATVQVDDDRDGNGSFSGSDRDDKQGKKQPIQLTGPQVFIERYKIQVHTVQDKFNAHEHRHKVSPGKKAIDANEK